MWGVVKLEDEGWFCLEVVGEKGVAIDCLMKVEFNGDGSIVNVGKSGLGICRKSLPRGYDV